MFLLSSPSDQTTVVLVSSHNTGRHSGFFCPRDLLRLANAYGLYFLLWHGKGLFRLCHDARSFLLSVGIILPWQKKADITAARQEEEIKSFTKANTQNIDDIVVILEATPSDLLRHKLAIGGFVRIRKLWAWNWSAFFSPFFLLWLDWAQDLLSLNSSLIPPFSSPSSSFLLLLFYVLRLPIESTF